jgi:hypothetical protein
MKSVVKDSLEEENDHKKSDTGILHRLKSKQINC